MGLTTLKISARILLLCCEEERRRNKEDTKSKTQTKETERRVEKTLVLFLFRTTARLCTNTFLFFPTRTHKDRQRRDLHLLEKRRTWAKTRRKGRRPRLPPPLRRFRRQKRRVLRRRRATTIQTTANQEEVRRNNTNKFNNNKYSQSFGPRCPV